MATNVTHNTASIEGSNDFTVPPKDPSETTSSTSLGNLQTFTVFPKLPIELRLIIWNFALPGGPTGDGKRIFRLQIHHPESKSDYPKGIRFSIGTKSTAMYWYKGEHPAKKEISIRKDMAYKEDMRDLRLLRVCQESRAVYLERFCRVVPAIGGGKLQFEVATTLYLENFGSLSFYKYAEIASVELRNPESDFKLPGWFDYVTDLAIPVDYLSIVLLKDLFGNLKYFSYDVDGTYDLDQTLRAFLTREQYESAWLQEYSSRPVWAEEKCMMRLFRWE